MVYIYRVLERLTLAVSAQDPARVRARAEAKLLTGSYLPLLVLLVGACRVF